MVGAAKVAGWGEVGMAGAMAGWAETAARGGGKGGWEEVLAG